MTRWARGNKGKQKRPHDASPWTELKDSKRDNNKSERPTKTLNEDAIKRKPHLDRTGIGERKVKRTKEDGSISATHHDAATDTLLQQEGDSLVARLASCRGDEVVEGDERKKERRREERRLKRIKHKADKMVCYHCRESGHGVSDCPKMLQDVEQGTGVCFRCGSTEHEANKCTAKVDPKQGEFPFAKCFVCQETGHLSSSCPDNPRGLYPLGGGCKQCGSVEHRTWHCPSSTQATSSEDTTLPTLDSTLGWSADAQIDEMQQQRPSNVIRTSTKNKTKIVKF